jgi:hypothetical protein
MAALARMSARIPAILSGRLCERLPAGTVWRRAAGDMTKPTVPTKAKPAEVNRAAAGLVVVASTATRTAPTMGTASPSVASTR